MWNDSDRMGYKDFLNLDIEQNFFVKEENSKTSVYYLQNFLSIFDETLKENVKSSLPKALKRMKQEWTYLIPYLEEESKISSYKELIEYYNHLVSWWSGMTTMFTAPDICKEEKMISELLELRKESEKHSDKMCSVMTNFLKNKFPLEYCIITIDEIKKLNDGKDIDISIIKQRKKGYVMDNGIIKVNSSFDEIIIQKGYSIYNPNKIPDGDVIIGNVAFPGNISGKVKIIKISNDLKNIEQNDVIVTEMTSPDYVPYLKKAAAIITDEGGITCHAAIVSRELGIPCVIGTKNATLILKTGDIVEVDAKKGIVKKID
ncbi:hypothetical protein HN385_05060 [archaeon]|nr:hypothetical protein [archaeon]MBT3465065.1 hypothetical protein [archaeon]MBT6869262.1 hypothetical protein [archaeon]MBT7193660.1 hypothetical protein [archaeon]MBT7380278.1 hypothetical protein [archaeon]